MVVTNSNLNNNNDSSSNTWSTLKIRRRRTLKSCEGTSKKSKQKQKKPSKPLRIEIYKKMIDAISLMEKWQFTVRDRKHSIALSHVILYQLASNFQNWLLSEHNSRINKNAARKYFENDTDTSFYKGNSWLSRICFCQITKIELLPHVWHIKQFS